MKLEKREITLNEKDSVKDMLVLEKYILAEYQKKQRQDFRKETAETLLRLREETEEVLKKIGRMKTEEV